MARHTMEDATSGHTVLDGMWIHGEQAGQQASKQCSSMVSTSALASRSIPCPDFYVVDLEV